jgi:hypothetical protein
MAEVKSFPSIAPTGPNEELVSLLESLLASAKEGKIQGMAFAAAERNGDLVTGWTKMPPRANVFALLGGLDYLRFSLMREELEEAPEKPLPWSS